MKFSINFHILKKPYLIIFSLIWSLLFSVSLMKYQGSAFAFTLFSFSFLILLFLGFYKNKSYAFMYLAVFLWLGFWTKLVAHLLLDYEYIEPIGVFSGSTGEWDQVLWVSTIACLGVIIGRFLYAILNFKVADDNQNNNVYPEWYPTIRIKVWALFIVIVILATVSNTVLGINQIGLSPRTILPWPLNALISWIVSIGGVMGLATLIWWDISLKKGVYPALFAITIEAFISSISLFSRGVFIFHSIPQFIALYKNKLLDNFSKKRLAIVGCFILIFFVLSLAIVSVLRANFYSQDGVTTTTKAQVSLSRLEVLKGGIARVKTLIRQGGDHKDHLTELLIEQEELQMKVSNSTSDFRLKLININEDTREIPDSINDKNVIINHQVQSDRVNESVALTLEDFYDQLTLSRLEVLKGGIARVKTLIRQGGDHKDHLTELLIEQEELQMKVSNSTSDFRLKLININEDTREIPDSINDKNVIINHQVQSDRVNESVALTLEDFYDQLTLSRLEVLKGGIARVKTLIRQGGDHKDQLTELLIEQEELQMKVSNSTSDQVQFDRVNANVALEEFYYQLTQGVFLKVLSLSVDRWVGLEGIMAVVSYPNKGRALIIDAFVEKRTLGGVTKYQEIANSKYQWVDSNVWQFASLPGAVAFLYFSGSFWIVLFGMILFAFLVQFLEFLIYKGTRNPILCSLLGVSIANNVTQFGIAPAQGSVYLFMIFVGILAIVIVQNLKLITNKLFS